MIAMWEREACSGDLLLSWGKHTHNSYTLEKSNSRATPALSCTGKSQVQYSPTVCVTVRYLASYTQPVTATSPRMRKRAYHDVTLVFKNFDMYKVES